MPPEQVNLRVSVEPGAHAPSYESEGAAGMDLRIKESVELAPMQRALVGTGVRMAIPPGYEGQVRPRSGTALKKGISLPNSPGTIDSDYRGEVSLILINLSSKTVQLDAGERVAQLVIAPVVRASVDVVEDLDKTARGTAGFGSTGTK